jgi:phosphatidylglycerophosphate synthase
VLASLARAQKSNRGAAGYSRWVNRPVGRQLAATAYRAGLSPNQVSVISAGFTFAGIVLLATLRPTWPLAVVVTASLLLGYAFDSADGQVARLRGGGTLAGEWLDHVLDALKLSTFHIAIAIMWFRYYDLHRVVLLIPLGFAVVSAVFFFALILSDFMRRLADARTGGGGVPTASVRPREAAPVLRSLVVLPNDYGVLCLSVLLIAAHPAFVATYAALFAANAIFLVVGSVRWYREVARL